MLIPVITIRIQILHGKKDIYIDIRTFHKNALVKSERERERGTEGKAEGQHRKTGSPIGEDRSGRIWESLLESLT